MNFAEENTDVNILIACCASFERIRLVNLMMTSFATALRKRHLVLLQQSQYLSKSFFMNDLFRVADSSGHYQELATILASDKASDHVMGSIFERRVA